MKNEKEVLIRTEYIKLGQLLKLCGYISNGSDAKFFLEENNVIVLGVKEERRGKKIYPGDTVFINEDKVLVNNDQN